jgi:hypothetical protein
MAGNLQIAASRNLGGLGVTQGPPVSCNWTTSGLMSPLLPWLAVLALLALKPNHGWSAWLIFLPLVCLVAGLHCLASQNPSGLPKEVFEVFSDVPIALAFGTAGLWLLTSSLDRQHRFRTFLCNLLILAGFTVFSFAATAGWDQGMVQIASLYDPRHCTNTAVPGATAFPLFLLLPLMAFVIAAALVLCGLICRGRYRPFLLYPCLFLSLLAVGSAVVALLHFLFKGASAEVVEFVLLFGIGPALVVVTSVTLLPFLLLSSACSLYRERLKTLLHVKPEPPPANASLLDANLKT